MKELNFTLTTDEATTVLRALSTMPYGQVYALINKIQQQATPQVTTPVLRDTSVPQKTEEN